MIGATAPTTAQGFTPSDWVAIVAIVASAVVVVGNNVLSAFYRARERDQDRREAHAREAFAIGGPLRAFVLDINPVRLTLWGLTPETAVERFTAIEERWGPIREGLAYVEVAHPSETVRNLSRELATAVHNSVVRTTVYAGDLLHPTEGGRELHDDAIAYYGEVTEKLEEWLLALREV